MRSGVLLDGRHRLVQRLGEGGMGIVWAARDEQTHADVVVKVLPAEAVTDLEAVGRFVREAKLALRVDHPNVARTIDLVTPADGPPYIVQERLVGETLEDRLARGVLAPAEAARVGVALLDALAAVHALGILHRDVKPANVFLCAGSSPPLVKLLDFGVARGGGEPALTRTGALVGTPAYMAPEQFLDDELDARVDVYAVGATLYECLAGRLPFSSGGVRLMKDVLGGELPALTDLRPDLDRELVAIVHTALAKSRDLRFATAQAMRARLAGWASIDDQRITAELRAPGAPRARPTQRPSPRTSRAPLAAVGVALLVVGVTASALLAWATSARVTRRSATIRALAERPAPESPTAAAPPPAASFSVHRATPAVVALPPRRFQRNQGVMSFGGLGDEEAKAAQAAFNAHVDSRWSFVECAPYDDRACNQMLVIVVHGDGPPKATLTNCFPPPFRDCVERTMRKKPFVPPPLSATDWSFGAYMAPP